MTGKALEVARELRPARESAEDVRRLGIGERVDIWIQRRLTEVLDAVMEGAQRHPDDATAAGMAALGSFAMSLLAHHPERVVWYAVSAVWARAYRERAGLSKRRPGQAS